MKYLSILFITFLISASTVSLHAQEDAEKDIDKFIKRAIDVNPDLFSCQYYLPTDAVQADVDIYDIGDPEYSLISIECYDAYRSKGAIWYLYSHRIKTAQALSFVYKTSKSPLFSLIVLSNSTYDEENKILSFESPIGNASQCMLKGEYNWDKKNRVFVINYLAEKRDCNDEYIKIYP